MLVYYSIFCFLCVLENRRWNNKLTSNDIDFIIDEMMEMKKDKWVEIIMGFEEQPYKRPRSIGETVRTRGRKLDCKVVDSPFHAYNITFSGYEIDKNRNVVPLKVRDERIKIVRCGRYSGKYKFN
jgi:hypothetical protein